MDLERVAAAIRPRSNWEALDLGFGLVRAWWRRIYAPWCALVVPLWLAGLVLATALPWLGFLLLWWLRPWLDRIPLFVLGRALFGAVPSPRETLRAAPALFWQRALPALTVERLNPVRSYFLPVRQLERARGVEHGLRVAALRREGLGEALVLTATCWLMELILFFSVLLFVDILVPTELESAWMAPLSHLDDGWSVSMGWMFGLAWMLAVLVVEPFYVAGGFALYLNRRTRLEGWDIELVLRRLVHRIEAAPSPPAAARTLRGLGGRGAMLLLIALSPLGAQTPAAWARQDVSTEPAADAAPDVTPDLTPKSRADVDAAMQKVYELPELSGSGRRTVYKWRFGSDDAPAREAAPSAWLSAVDGLAAVLEWGLWVLVGVGAAWLAVVLYRRRHLFASSDDADVEAPASRATAGFLAELPRLPRDIAGAALAAASAGRLVEALSLLYRGALGRALAVSRIEVRPSWTEGECLTRLAAALPEASAAFVRRLTLAWLGAAYAHRLPAGEEVAALCHEWNRHFGGAA